MNKEKEDKQMEKFVFVCQILGFICLIIAGGIYISQ